jgi:hypothetical protein
MMRDWVSAGALKHQPSALAAAVMSALADTTMDFIAIEPAQVKRFSKAGFDALWKAVGE